MKRGEERLFISEMQFEKDIHNIVRYITITNVAFSIDQLDIFKHIICDYFKAELCSIRYRGEIPYFFIENNKVAENKVILEQGEKYHEQVLKHMSMEGWVNGKTFDEFLLRVVCPRNIDGIDEKHIKQDLIKLCRISIKQIEQFISAIQTCEILKYQFKEYIEIGYEDFHGLYDFGNIHIDFGEKNTERVENKLACCTISYKKYFVKSS